jgi:hypothetical protein
MTTPATITNSAAPIQAPAYELFQTGSDRISIWGQLRVADAADLPAAMAAWKESWGSAYSPHIYADSVDPCIAHWRRWKSCE